jgi:hypothetical protein
VSITGGEIIDQFKTWAIGWLCNIGRQMYAGNFSGLIFIANIWAVAINVNNLSSKVRFQLKIARDDGVVAAWE